MSEQQPDRTADDDLPDAATSHGSDLDVRIGTDEDEAEQTLGADEAGP